MTWWRFTQTQTLGFRSKRARPVAEREEKKRKGWRIDGASFTTESHSSSSRRRPFLFLCFRLCLIIFPVVMASSRGRRRSEDSHRPQHTRDAVIVWLAKTNHCQHNNASRTRSWRSIVSSHGFKPVRSMDSTIHSGHPAIDSSSPIG